MISCIEMLLEHNFSVREPLLDTLRKLDNDDFTRNLGMGKGSLRNTLIHLMNTDIFWINLICEEDTPTLEAEEFQTVDDIARSWKRIEIEMREIIANQTDASLQHVKTVRIGDDTISFTIARAFLHMATHEGHHRGFIIGLLRQMGYDTPNVNMLRELTKGDGLL